MWVMSEDEKPWSASGGKPTTSDDVERFAEFIERQSMTMQQRGWLKGQLNLRRWASELREATRAKDHPMTY